jgi:hypothetical protein
MTCLNGTEAHPAWCAASYHDHDIEMCESVRYPTGDHYVSLTGDSPRTNVPAVIIEHRNGGALPPMEVTEALALAEQLRTVVELVRGT